MGDGDGKNPWWLDHSPRARVDLSVVGADDSQRPFRPRFVARHRRDDVRDGDSADGARFRSCLADGLRAGISCHHEPLANADVATIQCILSSTVARTRCIGWFFALDHVGQSTHLRCFRAEMVNVRRYVW